MQCGFELLPPLLSCKKYPNQEVRLCFDLNMTQNEATTKTQTVVMKENKNGVTSVKKEQSVKQLKVSDHKT